MNCNGNRHCIQSNFYIFDFNILKNNNNLRIKYSAPSIISFDNEISRQNGNVSSVLSIGPIGSGEFYHSLFHSFSLSLDSFLL